MFGNVQSDQPFDRMIEKRIAEQAYRYWENRGRPIGSPEVDWHRALEEVTHDRRGQNLGLGDFKWIQNISD